MLCPTIADCDPVIEAEGKPLPESFIHAETKPRLDSYDSAQEFSLQHLVQLYKLLEIEDYELDGYVFDDTCLHAA